MKTIIMRVCSLSIAAGGLAFVSGCVVGPDGRVGIDPSILAPPAVYTPPPPVYTPPQPPVVHPPPQQPVHVEPVPMAPETYAIVNGERVGLIGGRYYFMSGGVWRPADQERMMRYQRWERENPGWRDHAIHNQIDRRDPREPKVVRPPVHPDLPGHSGPNPNVGPGQPQQPPQQGQPPQQQQVRPQQSGQPQQQSRQPQQGQPQPKIQPQQQGRPQQQDQPQQNGQPQQNMPPKDKDQRPQ